MLNSPFGVLNSPQLWTFCDYLTRALLIELKALMSCQSPGDSFVLTRKYGSWFSDCPVHKRGRGGRSGRGGGGRGGGGEILYSWQSLKILGKFLRFLSKPLNNTSNGMP